MSIVKVEPLPLEGIWHGKVGEKSIRQPQTIQALYDKGAGGYATGLTEEEVKEYSVRVTGKENGLNNTYNMDEPHPFWGSKTAKVRLLNQTMIFNTKNPLDFVKVKMLKASKFVANSMKEWQEGDFPSATHFIYDEQEEMQEKVTKVERQSQAYELLNKLPDEAKISFIQIILNQSMRGASSNKLKATMGEIIETHLDQLLELAKANPASVFAKGNVMEALQKGILTKQGTAIYYMGDFIAADVDSAVEWYLKPESQTQKALILSKLS